VLRANEDNEQENGRPKLLAKSLVVDHFHANLVAENAVFPA
jgi:hypothetical protein